MNTFTYQGVTVDCASLGYQFSIAGQVEGGESYNSSTKELIVYTDLDKVTCDAVVAAHDPDSLFSQKITKVNEFNHNTQVLVSGGMIYGGVVMGVNGESKSLYTSIAADDDNAGVNISYPIQFPGLNSGALSIVERAELDAFITEVNERLIYLYEDQVNADLSKGLVAYSKDIFQAADVNALDAIIDTRK